MSQWLEMIERNPDAISAIYSVLILVGLLSYALYLRSRQ